MEALPISWSELPQSLGWTVFQQVSAERELFGGSSSSSSNNNNNNNNGSSEDVLVPPFDSEKRNLTLGMSTLCLVMTLTSSHVGLLAMPQVVAQCGWIGTAILLILVSWWTMPALNLLCHCARRSGGATLSQVAKVAGGDIFSMVTSGVAALVCGIVLVLNVMSWRLMGTQALAFALNTREKWILLVMLLLLFPIITRRELHSYQNLYWLWVVALVGTLTCLIALAVCAITNSTDTEPWSRQTLDAPNIWWTCGIPYSIMSLFGGTFNVLQIQASLQGPTRERMTQCIRWAVTISAFIAYAVGLLGDLAGTNSSQSMPQLANNNLFVYWTVVVTSNPTITPWIRVGWGFLSWTAFPLLFVPGRRHLLEFIDKAWIEPQQQDDPHTCCHVCREQCPEVCEECCDEDPDEQTCMTFPSLSTYSVSTGSRSPHPEAVFAAEETALLPRIGEERIRRCNIQNNLLVHYSCTFGMLLLIYFLAVVLPVLSENSAGSRFWNIMGYSLGLLVSFGFPAVCFLWIQDRDPYHPQRLAWFGFSWLSLLLAATILALCIWRAVSPVVQLLAVQIVHIV